jgi:hypothetical protein
MVGAEAPTLSTSGISANAVAIFEIPETIEQTKLGREQDDV